MPRKTKGWVCNFCDTISLLKKDIERHEKYCRMNPKNKSCKTCGRYTEYCGYGRNHQIYCIGWKVMKKEIVDEEQKGV